MKLLTVTRFKLWKLATYKYDIENGNKDISVTIVEGHNTFPKIAAYFVPAQKEGTTLPKPATSATESLLWVVLQKLQSYEYQRRGYLTHRKWKQRYEFTIVEGPTAKAQYIFLKMWLIAKESLLWFSSWSSCSLGWELTPSQRWQQSWQIGTISSEDTTVVIRPTPTANVQARFSNNCSSGNLTGVYIVNSALGENRNSTTRKVAVSWVECSSQLKVQIALP